MVRFGSRIAGWVVGLSLVWVSVTASGRSLIEFKVTRGDKVEGRYDMGIVRNEGSTFVVGNFYPGAQALKGKKRGAPDNRLYGELDSEGRLGKYKRWVKHGVTQEYWMVFLFKNEIKLRHEDVEGGKGRVDVLGKILGKTPAKEPGKAAVAISAEAPLTVLPGVVPLDPGMPALAWALLGKAPFAHEAMCAGTTPGAWGKAWIVSAGTRDFADEENGTVTLAHWKVEGDCGAFDLFLGDDGIPVRMVAGDRKYERFVRK